MIYTTTTWFLRNAPYAILCFSKINLYANILLLQWVKGLKSFCGHRRKYHRGFLIMLQLLKNGPNYKSSQFILRMRDSGLAPLQNLFSQILFLQF